MIDWESSTILILEPKTIDGIHKDEIILLLLYNISILQRFLVLYDCIGVAKVINLLHCLRSKVLLTIANRL